MFGGFDFGEPYFADELGIIAPAPRPVKPVPLRTLVVPCRTRVCDDISHDNDRNGLGNYDLQAVAVAAKTPTPLVECRKRVCADISGVGPFSALTIYSLQDALFFNGTELSFIVDCPVGYTCDPGTFPIEFRYPPGRFYIPPPDPIPGFPIVISLQGCSSMVSLVLPSGSTQAAISAASQQVINQVAAQQALCDAQQIAKKNPAIITLSDLPTDFCLGTTLALSVTASYTPHTTPTTFTLDSNQLPPGVNVSQNTTTMFLTGTPTTPGTYVFTVTATAPNASGSKTYSISISGIANTSPLPDADINYAYSVALDGSSMPGFLTWSSADLPAWLNLNTATGALFGNPSISDLGTYSFLVTLTNGLVTCQKQFTVSVKDPAGVFWNIVWGAPSIALVGSGAGTAGGAGNTGSSSSSVGAYGGLGPANTATVSIVGTLTITTVTPILGFITGSATASKPSTGNWASVDVTVNGGSVFDRAQPTGPNFGTGSFTIPAGVGQVMVVTLQSNSGSGAGVPPDGDAMGSATSFVVNQV